MPQRADSRLRRYLTAIAAIVAATVVCAITATSLFATYYDRAQRVQAEADAAAAQVSKFAYAAPEAWWYQLERLEEFISAANPYRGHSDSSWQVRVFRSDGEPVLALGAVPPGPRLVRTSAISDGFRIVGRVELAHDTRAIWIHGLVAFGVGLALALAVFVVLRTLPLRALRRRDAALAEAHRRAATSEDRAIEAHQRLLEAIEAVGGGFALYDGDDKLAIYNRQFADMFPVIADLIRPGVPFQDLARAAAERGESLDGAAEPEAWIRRRITTHRRARGSFIDRMADGRWMLVSERVLPDGSTISSYLDITELKDTEQRLREQEETLRLISDAVPVLIAYLDADQRYRFINRVAEEWHSRPRDDIIGKSLEELAPARTCETLRPYVARVLAGEEVQAEVEAYYSTGITRIVRIKYVPHVGAGGEIKGFFALIEDITEERQTREMLEQSQRMDAVGQLTSGIAHDFNNILSVILGNLEILEDRLKDDSLLRSWTQTALRAALRGGELTQRLLTFARKQNLEPRRVELPELIDGAVELFRSSLFQKMTLATDLPADIKAVKVDPGQFEVALLNLVINARDAMPDGGTITIRARNVTADGGAGDYVLLSVIDQGNGMSDQVVKHVFEPFFTTKPVGKGSGLGLSMVYGFIKQSGGHIAIESTESAGTTVNLYLPLADPSAIAHGDTGRTTQPQEASRLQAS